MDLRFDLTTNTCELIGCAPLEFKWRSRVPLRLQFHRAGVSELLPSGYGLRLSLLSTDGVLAAALTADITAAVTVNDWYVGEIILHTAALTEAFATAATVRVPVTLELHWWREGQASAPFISDNLLTGSILRPGVLPESDAPIVLPGAEEWLSARAVLFSDVQTLTQLQREQALANLGITISAAGLLTLPTGHTISLNAPL